MLGDTLGQRWMLELPYGLVGGMAALLSGVCVPSHALLLLATILGSEGATGGGSLLATAAQPVSSQAAQKSPVLFDLWADSVRSCTPILCLLSTATNLSKRRGADVFSSSRGASEPYGREPPARRSSSTTTV